MVNYRPSMGVRRTHKAQYCRKTFRKFTKDFVVVNKLKAAFCYALYDKMLDFDNDKFYEYLKYVRTGMQQMIAYRSNIYCALCDVHQ